MRLIDKIRQMNEDELAEWLCRQMWQDYGKDQMMSAIRFHQVRNFLLMEASDERSNRQAGGD